MGFGLDMLVVVLLFFGSGGSAGRDLLDMMPTDAYWEAKHVRVSAAQLEADAGPTPAPEHVDQLLHDLESPEFKIRDAAKRKIYAMGPAVLPSLKGEEESKDPEVKTAATDLVTRLESHEQEREVRRLMAIRTLGERKEQGAVGLLKGLEGSKELFVSEYAGRAVARIEGESFAGPDHRAAVAGDLGLVPGDASLVAQCVGLSAEPMTVETFASVAMEQASLAPPGAGAAKIPEKAELIRHVVAGLLRVADRIGDVRFDGITVEVSKDVGPAGGSAVVILRGEYDRDAVIRALEGLQGNEPAGEQSLKVTDEGGVKELEGGEEGMSALMPSNEQLMLLVAGKKPGLAQVKGAMLAAIKSGKGTLDQNAGLGALLKKIDTHAPLWAVAQLNADMRKEKLFEGFETITLDTKFEKGGTAFVFTGEGGDSELVKGSTEELKSGIASSIIDSQMMAAREKRFGAMLDFFQKLKVESTGTHATLGGAVEQPLLRIVLQESAPMMLGAMMDDDAEKSGPTSQP